MQDHAHILVNLGIVNEILDESGEPVKNAPLLYVFSTLRHFRAEIEGYINKPDSEDPIDKDDHLMTPLKYMILQRTTYMGRPEDEPALDDLRAEPMRMHRQKKRRRPTVRAIR